MGFSGILLQLTLVAVVLFELTAAAVAFPIALPDRCGDVEIPYPFGLREGCYINDNFYVYHQLFRQNPTSNAWRLQYYKHFPPRPDWHVNVCSPSLTVMYRACRRPGMHRGSTRPSFSPSLATKTSSWSSAVTLTVTFMVTSKMVNIYPPAALPNVKALSTWTTALALVLGAAR